MATIITTNTIWSAGQTVNLNDSVEVAPGVTLTIEPGAVVNGNGNSIIVFGRLNATGEPGQSIALNNVKTYFGNAIATPGRIVIDHAKITGGTLFPATGNEVYGSFSVTNSVIVNAGPSYVWHPIGNDNVFSGNVFINSGGLSIGTSSQSTVQILGNAFINTSGNINGTAAVVAWASYGNPAEVSNNSFFGSGPALEVSIDGKIAGTGNYFGTTDAAAIANLILDRTDSLSRPSIINTGINANEPTAGVIEAIARTGLPASQALAALGYVVGTNGSDSLSGTDGKETILAGDGNDAILIGLGADVLNAGAGDDVFTANAVRVTNPAPADIGEIDGGVGTDALDLRAVLPTTLGTIQTGPSTFSFGVFIGNQRYAIRGIEEILLGSNNDNVSLPSSASGVTLRTGGGRDVVTISGALTTQTRPTAVYTESGDDEVFISGVFGATAQYIVDGGDGINLLKTNISFTVDLAAGTAQSSGAQYIITAFQNVMATAHQGYRSTIRGDNGNNVLSVNPLFNDGSVGTIFDGRGGNDTLSGSAGDDELFGGSGNDRINGSAGNDIIDGGDGFDTAVFSGGRSSYEITRSGDAVTIRDLRTNGDGSDRLTAIERVEFSDAAFTFSGFQAPGEPRVADFTSGAGGWTTQDRFPRQMADVNGDGRADIVGFGQAGTLVALGTTGGRFAPPVVAVANFGVDQGWTSDNIFRRALADVNGDGRDDIVGFGTAGVLVSLAQAGGTFGAPALGSTNFNPANGWSAQDGFARTLADVNGDGFADIIGFGTPGTFVALGTGAGGFGAANLALANFGANQGWTSNTQFHREVGDVNGDGRADIVGFGTFGTLVALGQANGTFAAPVFALNNFGTNQGWSSQDIFTRDLADVDGDGRADIIGFGVAGTFVAYGLDNGVFSAAEFELANFGRDQGWRSDNIFHRELADVNGDGRADIVGFGQNGVFAALAFDGQVI